MKPQQFGKLTQPTEIRSYNKYEVGEMYILYSPILTGHECKEYHGYIVDENWIVTSILF